MKVSYFHERDVLSDDPFTPEIEPSIPYSLAVMVQNQGKGLAKNVRITSGQPQIIDNERGLLIDFNIIATEVAGQNLTPSLTANFGNIDPDSIAIGRWLLTSTLQGLFIDYAATFEHIDGLGNPKLSLIESVDIHEMIHLVRDQRNGADTLPDFLVNDVPDIDDRPDTIYLSDGSIEPVNVVENGMPLGLPGAGNLEVQLVLSNAPAGWTYARLPDPADGTLLLANVRRSDGTNLLADNFWTTDRTFIGMGLRPIRENILHLLDHDSTGSYTLIYAPAVPPDTTPPSSAVAALPVQSGPQIPVTWSGTDNVGGGGIASYDIYVSSNNAAFTLWLQGTAQSGSIYNGVPGSTYAFYSIATDAAGNRESAPATPDAVTGVTLSNSPPALATIANQAIDEGTELNLSVTVTDADLPNDVLTFSLLSAPPGVTLTKSSQTTAQLRWPTGEGNGPSTNLVSVRVRDNGIPSFSATQTFTVIIREVNTAPTLAAITNRTINEGQLLTIQASGSDSDLPLQTLSYSLGRKPSGASISASSGVLSWQPTDIQGGTNYPVDIIVSENGVPSLSATQSFIVTVKNTRSDFAFSIGSTNVVPGESNSVPLLASSGVDLTELSLLLETDPARLGNLALQSVAAGVGSSFQLNGNQAQVQLTGLNALSLDGDSSLGRLSFLASSNEHSSVVPLRALNVQGRQANGSLLANPSVGSGRVFIVGKEPILDAGLRTNGARALTLYGQAGKHYVIESRTNLMFGPWQVAGSVDLSAPWMELDGVVSLEPSVYLRAVERPVTMLAMQRQGSHLVLSWPVSDGGCVLEQAISMTPPVNWVVVTGGVSVLGGRLTTTVSIESNRFFRLRCGGKMPVANGGFEAEDWSGLGFPLLPNDDVGFRPYLGLYGRALSGWNRTASSGIAPIGVHNTSAHGPAPEGEQFVGLGQYPLGGQGVEQTVFGFQTGKTYRVSFSISSQYYFGPARVMVSFETGSPTPVADFGAPLAVGHFWDRWDRHTLPFVATNSSVTIRFTDMGSPGGLTLGLDDVQITEDRP